MAEVLPLALKITIKQIRRKHREWRESVSYASGNEVLCVYSGLKSHIQMFRTQKKIRKKMLLIQKMGLGSEHRILKNKKKMVRKDLKKFLIISRN